MKITHKINIHLDAYEPTPEIVVMQGDANVHELEFTFCCNNAAWQVPAPSAAKFYVFYSKSDGKGGFYDTLPDGVYACTVGDNNTLSAILAPQVLTVPGKVPVSITIQEGDQILATFSVQLNVKAKPGVGAIESKDYFCLKAAVDAAVVAAQKPVTFVVVSREEGARSTSHSVEEIRALIDSQTPVACYWYEKEIVLSLASYHSDVFVIFTSVIDATEYSVEITGNTAVFSEVDLAKASDISGFLTEAPVKSVNGQTGDVTVPTAVKVTVTQQADGSYDADLHSEEIVEANDAGKMVYCQNGYRVLTLLYATYTRCIFGCVHNGYIHTVTIGASGASVASTPLATGDGSGSGADGITPHIGDNGNWFIGETDTGMPSRGEVGPTGVHVGPDAPEDDAVHVWVDTDEDSNAELPSGGDGGYYTPVVTQTEPGKAEFSWTASKEGMPDIASRSVTLPQGEPGADGKEGPQGEPGKSAYQYAQDGGYTGTEEEFAEKLAADLPAGGSSYTLPIATSEILGGVKPVAKSDDMTQSVGVDADGGLWTKLGATTGTGGVFKTIADFTTTETVAEIQIPIDTDELAELCHSAKELRVLIHIEKDSSDTTTENNGDIEFGANPGWYAEFATVAEVIPAATTDWQNYSDTYIVAFCDAGQYVPSPVLIAKALQNTGATVEALQANWISPDIVYVDKGHFFYVRGTQNMGAGTRVVLEVAT